jgi:hypothetical protein
MSRAYRVTVSGSVDRVVHVEDGVSASLELLPILAKERMREILGAELARRGFALEDGVARRTEEGDVCVEVDLARGAVTVRVASEAEVRIARERSTRVGQERADAAREVLQKQLDEEIEAEAKLAEDKARRDATARLEAKLRGLKKEMDQVVNRVTADALKEKARQLGEIEELVEDAESGALTIKVRV